MIFRGNLVVQLTVTANPVRCVERLQLISEALHHSSSGLISLHLFGDEFSGLGAADAISGDASVSVSGSPYSPLRS